MARIRCLPYIGRLGPSYSRYLTWRANDSKNFPMMLHPGKRKWMSQEEIELIAKKLLNGEEMPEIQKKAFDRIWLVGEGGKKQARQVIKKD